MTESDKEELRTMLQGVIIQSDFTIDTYKKLSHTVTTVSMKNKKIDDDTLNGVITIDITTSSNIHPILAPETSHDISEIGAGF